MEKGRTKKVGVSRVSWGCLSVCAGVPPPLPRAGRSHMAHEGASRRALGRPNLDLRQISKERFPSQHIHPFCPQSPSRPSSQTEWLSLREAADPSSQLSLSQTHTTICGCHSIHPDGKPQVAPLICKAEGKGQDPKT